MVSVKPVNNKRRGNGKQNNNKRFKPAINGSNHNNYNARAINTAMFSINQFPDYPGYVDFNEPSPIIPPLNISPTIAAYNSINNNNVGGAGGRGRGGKMIGKSRFCRGGGHPVKERMIPNSNNSIGNNMGYNGGNLGNRRSGGGSQRNSSGHGPITPQPNRSYRNSYMSPRMVGPMSPQPMMCGPPMPPPPLPMMNGRFGPRPFIPQSSPQSLMGRPPMRGGLMPPPLRNRRSIRNVPSILPTNNITTNRRNLRNRKRGGGATATQTQSDTIAKRLGNNAIKKLPPTKKTLKEIVNQYSLDRPWITDEIRDLAKIKEDIENKLKGKKDDKLFAEFKIQRDKFVTIYEAAKKAYIENNRKSKDIEKTLTVSDKTNSKQETISKETC